jgi:hypothetical protein
MKKSMLVKLIDKWESEKGSYITNVPIYELFIGESKTFLEKEKKKSMLPDLIKKFKSIIPNENLAPRYLYDLFIIDAENLLEKEKKKLKSKKLKKNLTISNDNANAKANALLKDYSFKYCKKIVMTSIMLAIEDGDNKVEEYWKDVLIEIKKMSNV